MAQTTDILGAMQLDIATKAVLKVPGTARGTNFVTMDSLVNGTLKFSAAALSIGTNGNTLLILSRWASVPGSAGTPIIVDALQSCGLKAPEKSGLLMVKVNRDANLNMAGKHAEKCKKKGRYWGKEGLKQGCDAIAAVESGLLFDRYKRWSAPG